MQENELMARGLARFWQSVDRRGPEECWNWIATKRAKGYGHFNLNYKSIRAHIFSYELMHGRVPAGLLVIHSCDNPSCVNPAHLRAGTPKDNNADMVSRWRHRYGSKHPRSKLTEQKVREMRDCHKERDLTYRELGALFGISGSTAYKIVVGSLWSHV